MKFAEDLASNHALGMALFKNVDDAEKWLNSEGEN